MKRIGEFKIVSALCTEVGNLDLGKGEVHHMRCCFENFKNLYNKGNYAFLLQV